MKWHGGLLAHSTGLVCISGRANETPCVDTNPNGKDNDQRDDADRQSWRAIRAVFQFNVIMRTQVVGGVNGADGCI